VNQSKLEANTCSRGKARENVCERVAIGFGFTSDWMTKWHEFLSHSRSVVMKNHSKGESTFDPQVKTSLRYYK